MQRGLTIAGVAAVLLLVAGLSYALLINRAEVNLNPVSADVEEEITAFLAGYASTTDNFTAIEVMRVEGMADDSYIAEGTAKSDTASFPATVRVQKIDGVWTVIGFQKLQVSSEGDQVTVEGTWECLPHRGDGPHTLECALGILLDGAHYAVTTTAGIDSAHIPTGTRVRVIGVMVPIYPDSGTGLKYDINGVIDASSIQKI